MPAIACRDATPQDAHHWHALWQEYLRFYGVTLAPGVTETTFARAMSADSPLGILLAQSDGRIAGFAMWHCHLTTWSTAPDCYLEDLFVAADARGQGLGRALIETLQERARSLGCGRLYWMTDQANTRARSLYDSFSPADGHLRYRITV